jgi:hypothetical protein
MNAKRLKSNDGKRSQMCLAQWGLESMERKRGDLIGEAALNLPSHPTFPPR